ncbi:hemagglutinin [Acinetobacter sp. Ac_3412]|uniref:two-partner secretion domain-containing protein n=1 Tax=Acinetobacter sp. Ac_3412 TaxID=1848935 RepID=UPI00148F5965|nr:DUF637 domain-containing protein [Acinetobacter sp. Ac_3412]NNP76179.1 hemagglutinin [Acinetobacter sp. Ac_3412]
MNKQFYRTKFNAKLGTYVAVSELAKSHQGDTSPRIKASIHSNHDVTDSGIAAAGQRTLKQLVLALSGLMAISPIYANVVVNNNAAAAHKATVLKEGNAANVWITAPSASGVSRNSYTQFDVNQNGVILNNSRGAATSQITKTSIAANPNLAKGAATTIVNEVVSTNPSLLQGNLEVLGSRANVVIANPTGITVNGGGFINANQVTLSTGVLGYNSDGSIKDHTVKQGAITINPDANNRGLGGNANNPVALELLGRSIAINAPVNATTITAVTGANTIAADTGAFTATTGTGTKPTVAIDVAQLGGLYANSIYLYANEAGVGVNNAGVIQALNNVVLNSNGKIEHKGTISSTSKTQGLVSISTTGTGVAGDINSSGSINSNSMIKIDSGNNLNVNAKEIMVNLGGVTASPLLINVKGNLNLAANSRIFNDSQSGELYVDAANINLATNSGLTSNRASAYIQSQKDIVTAQGARLIAAQDLNVSSKGKLSLIGNTLYATLGSINLQADSSSTQGLIDIQTGTIYAGKDLNLYSTGDINLKNLGLAVENSASRVKNIKAYSGQNLKWDNAGITLPQITGKVQLDAANQLDLVGSTISNKDDITLQANKINLGTALSSQKNINITSRVSDLSLDKALTAQGDINVVALVGNLNVTSVKAKSTAGEISLLANKSVIVESNQSVESRFPTNKVTTINNTDINGAKGVTIGSIGDGSVGIRATNIISGQGDIQIIGENGVSLSSNTDVYVSGDDPYEVTIPSFLLGKNINIKNKKGGVNVENTSLQTSQGNLSINNQVGMTTIKDSFLTSIGNTELYAKDLLTLQGVSAKSDQHLALNSGRTVYINAEYTPATVWIPNKVTNLSSKGVTSVTATGNQVIQNANITGGAVLMEAGGFILNRTGMNYNATGSDLLKNDKKLNGLNGSLSVQMGNDLIIDPQSDKLTAIGNIDLISKKGNLTLKGYGGTSGNGSEKVVSLKTVNGGINLQGNKVELQGTQLAAAKDINIVAASGDVVIDGVKNQLISSPSKSQVSDLNTLKFINDTQWQYTNNLLNDNSATSNVMKAIIGDENLRNLKVYYENEGAQINSDLGFFSSNLNGYEHKRAEIQTSGNINIASKNGILVRGASVSGAGKVLLESKGTLTKALTAKDTQDQVNAGILIDGLVNSYEKGNENDANYSVKEFFRGAYIGGSQGVDIKATGLQATDHLVAQGAKISSSGDVNLESTHDLILLAGQDQSYDKWTNITKKRSWYGKKKTTTTINQYINTSSIPVTIDAQNINLKSLGDTTLYSTEMAASTGGKVDIKARNLKLLVTDELNKKETTTRKKSSFWGLKYNDTKTNNSYKELTQVPVKAKGDYINTRTDYDTIIQGAEFNYLKAASVQAGGKIELLPATNLVENTSTKKSNSVVWQSMQDKGSITETAKLPSFNGPSAPEFKAAGGLVVQIPVGEKDQNKVQLKEEVLKLANQPGNQYLKDLIGRDDVDWQKMILTQKDWDYKSQGLTAAGAAILAIVIAAVTAGAGAAALGTTTSVAGSGTITAAGTTFTFGAAGGSVTTFGGVVLSTTVGTGAAAVTTYTALGTAVNAALTTLAIQSSVGLANNGGDVGKTLKELGSKDSVRNLAVTVATAGLLKGVATNLKISGDAAVNELANRMANGMIQGVGSTLIDSAINGRNLSEGLEKALLAGLANSLQAPLAGTIGDTLGMSNNAFVSKVVAIAAHAAASCATGLVDNQCQSRALGAALGEVIAENMFKPANGVEYTVAEKERILNISKLTTGVVAAYTGYDVTAAANAADTAVTNNYLNHAQEKLKKQELNSCKGVECGGLRLKWAAIDAGQDIGYATGFVAGIPTALGESAIGLVQMRLNPMQTARVLKDILSSENILGTITNAVKDEYTNRINKLEAEYQKAGPSGSYKAGLELGKITTDMVSLLAGGASLAKGGLILTEKVAAKVSYKVLKDPVIISNKGVPTTLDGHKIYDPEFAPLGSNEKATYRFSDPVYRKEFGGTGGDVYFGENIATSYFEVRQAIGGKSLFVGQVEVKNMLDLTDPKILKQMGIDQKKLTQKIDDANEAQKASIYAYTNNIANQAYAKGYTGIIYNSSRNTEVSNNRVVVLFGGRYDPAKIKPVLDKPILIEKK